jgi:hypothetical protein
VVRGNSSAALMAERISWSVRTLQEQTIMDGSMQAICHRDGGYDCRKHDDRTGKLSSNIGWIDGIDLDSVNGFERSGLKE